jgi:excisionase family DNA binding protein
MSWPWPGDSALDRAKRIAQSYRAELLAADPAACELLDQRAEQVGEGWVRPTLVHVDIDDWVRVDHAAELVGRGRDAIHKWIQRGKLRAIKDEHGRSTVRVGDVLALSAEVRRRRAERSA